MKTDITKTLVAFALAALFAASAAAQAPLKPEDFAYRGSLTVSGAGPFHQLALPLEVYQGLASADLADLRVFNRQGEALPYALLRSKTHAVAQKTESAAPFFPLRTPGGASPGASDVAVTVRQNADGTLVSVQQSPAKAEPGDVVRGVVVDASAIKGRVRSLRLITGESAEPFHSYTIESSPDLQQWRVLKRDAQVVHLEHAGHRVDNDGAEWDVAADRYLRLVWDNPQRAPEIKSVALGVVETSIVSPARVWSGDVAPSAVQPGVYEYDLPGQTPLERLRINLPQVNTLAPVDIRYLPTHRQAARPKWRSGRDEAQRWEGPAHAVVYRLQTPQGEVRSADVALSGAASSRLRLTVDSRSGGVGSTPPTVQIGFEPNVVVFLARGEGPFVLAWGADGVDSADLPASTLLPVHNGETALNATPASLAPSDIIRGKPAPATKTGPDASSGSSKWVLWVVLLAGLLVLGGMARSLTRQLRQPPK